MSTTATIDLSPLARELGLRPQQVENVVALLDASNTVPFITRYRKDQTGGLNEEQIRQVEARITRLRLLEQRKHTILRSIDAQGKLTPELAEQIQTADSFRQLEDLYLPYKPKKQTLATTARERGLEPLADEIAAAAETCRDLDARAADFVNLDRQVGTAAEALLGAGHILAEHFSERADLRAKLRSIVERTGKLVAAKGTEDEKAAAAFRDFFEFSEPLHKVPPHRVLAINRGERAKVLRVKIDADSAGLEKTAEEMLVPPEHSHADFLRGCARDALNRLILPSLEREFRRELTDRAEAKAVEVFARNLRNLLLQPPIRGRRVLAIDPGFKSGCKVVALDEFGNHLENAVVHVTGKEEQRREAAKAKLAEMITSHQASVVAIGNGTACRETEAVVADLISQQFADRDVAYVIVNEAGASVYSTNAVGREEFPDLDATVRGAISIGRRLQDPLSELVKIEPPNIGVGMYQHDVKAKHLSASLDAVVESCVNFVGVDLNTASVSLLKYVSGLNALTARRVFEHRAQQGPFKTREQLKDVPGLGEATFVQAAGFLRIQNGENPLDATWIHPESYAVAQRVLEKLGFSVAELSDKDALARLSAKTAELNTAELAQELNVGELTFKDILTQLARPGRDPREDLPAPLFKREVLKLEDLHPGMELRGSVLNVVDFGAFVDIGLKDTGLVHISQLANKYVKEPHEVVAVGDVVRVWVMSIDKERRRVSLTMILPGTERTKPERRARPEPKPGEERPAPAKRRRRRDRGQRPQQPPQQAPIGQAGTAVAAAAPPAQTVEKRPPPRKPPRPAAPPPKLSKAKKEGREPLRTFAELAVFIKEQKPGDQPEAQQT
jgi:uncharacterized protein